MSQLNAEGDGADRTASAPPTAPTNASVFQYDALVVGGGLAGVLTAARLVAQRPGLAVAILERAPALGGRLSVGNESASWSYGLGAISSPLFEFWDQTLKLDPDARDLPSFAPKRAEMAGVVTANHLHRLLVGELVTPKLFQLMGGAQAAKEWSRIQALMETTFDDDPSAAAVTMAKYLGADAKGPLGRVLPVLALALGVPDVWGASASSFADRARAFAVPWYRGAWRDALTEMTSPPEELRGNLEKGVNMAARHVDCHVTESEYTGGQWLLHTSGGDFRAPVVIAAHAPWDLSVWMEKALIPPSVRALQNHAKPASAVILTQTIEDGAEDFPDLLVVPSESVRVVVEGSQICYQAILDHERSMEAPEVAKAVRRLRRARAKVHIAVPELRATGEHLALLPIAWEQSTRAADRRWYRGAADAIASAPNLYFSGGAYGVNCNEDENLIKSVLRVST